MNQIEVEDLLIKTGIATALAWGEKPDEVKYNCEIAAELLSAADAVGVDLGEYTRAALNKPPAAPETLRNTARMIARKYMEVTQHEPNPT